MEMLKPDTRQTCSSQPSLSAWSEARLVPENISVMNYFLFVDQVGAREAAGHHLPGGLQVCTVCTVRTRGANFHISYS